MPPSSWRRFGATASLALRYLKRRHRRINTVGDHGSVLPACGTGRCRRHPWPTVRIPSNGVQRFIVTPPSLERGTHRHDEHVDVGRAVSGRTWLGIRRLGVRGIAGVQATVRLLLPDAPSHAAGLTNLQNAPQGSVKSSAVPHLHLML